MKGNMKSNVAVAVMAFLAAASSVAGVLDNAWLKGTTDKDPLSYAPGEEMTFTVTPQGIDGAALDGEYFLDWKRSDDFGFVEKGRIAFTGEPFVYKTKLDKAGFVRLEAYVVDKDGKRYVKKFTGDATTPEGKRAMNRFERSKKNVFFDGGAGVQVETLASHEEPKDFDEFWARQYKRLDLVPIKDERREIKSANPQVRLYAVRIDCAGLRPVTGYLSIPKVVDNGTKFPCRLETHGYSGSRCNHDRPGWSRDNEIVLNINAHGLKLVEFGATEADKKALRWEVRSNGNDYAFDAKQNEDPEVAYFNGMVLRVKRGLQYLKTLKEWNGRDLFASGGSQGGLQTIWAAGCGEGVTLAESGITWCCDMFNNNARREHKISSDGWYIPWTESMGYYDAVNFAKRIPVSCRTIITRAGLGDYCCPPLGLAKLYNNISGNKRINWVQGSEHGYVPPEYEGRDFHREVPAKAKYTPDVAKRPQVRGVMLSQYTVCEDDFRTLKEWGATVARYQMYPVGDQWKGKTSDCEGFAAWLDWKLGVLKKDVLPLARKYGISLVVDLHVPPGGRGGSGMKMLDEPKWSGFFVECWGKIASQLKDEKGVYAYDLINEPTQFGKPKVCDYLEIQRRAACAVRKIDATTPVIVSCRNDVAWCAPSAFKWMEPLDLVNVFYQFHMYEPFDYTHQKVLPQFKDTVAAYPDAAKGWNAEGLRRIVAPVREFEKKYGARIFVGEFSAVAYAKGCDKWLADTTAMLNEYGWDWCYHAFREWPGWSVEHEVTSGDSAKTAKFAPSVGNSRMRVLKAALRRRAI